MEANASRWKNGDSSLLRFSSIVKFKFPHKDATLTWPIKNEKKLVKKGFNYTV